ncbi:MAG: YraN family protein [Clostridiales bacterium]|nr:YraN family protein [Clostridiales bacterium]
MNKRAIGTTYERQVGAYLQNQGYRILEYNFRCKSGEIDIVARDGSCLVFVEVKYRKNKDKGMPLEAVNRKKQQTISNVAACYCLMHGYCQETPCRFDVAAVLGEELTLIKNAFEYCGGFSL